MESQVNIEKTGHRRCSSSAVSSMNSHNNQKSQKQIHQRDLSELLASNSEAAKTALERAFHEVGMMMKTIRMGI